MFLCLCTSFKLLPLVVLLSVKWKARGLKCKRGGRIHGMRSGRNVKLGEDTHATKVAQLMCVCVCVLCCATWRNIQWTSSYFSFSLFFLFSWSFGESMRVRVRSHYHSLACTLSCKMLPCEIANTRRTLLQHELSLNFTFLLVPMLKHYGNHTYLRLSLMHKNTRIVVLIHSTTQLL